MSNDSSCIFLLQALSPYSVLGISLPVWLLPEKSVSENLRVGHPFSGKATQRAPKAKETATRDVFAFLASQLDESKWMSGCLGSTKFAAICTCSNSINRRARRAKSTRIASPRTSASEEGGWLITASLFHAMFSSYSIENGGPYQVA